MGGSVSWNPSRACNGLVCEKGGKAGIRNTIRQLFNTQAREANSLSHKHKDSSLELTSQ